MIQLLVPGFNLLVSLAKPQEAYLDLNFLVYKIWIVVLTFHIG